MSSSSTSPKIVECLNFIEGKWETPDEKLGVILSPFNGKTIANTYRSSFKTIDKAVQTSKTAQKEWGQLSYRDRALVMNQFKSWLLGFTVKLGSHIKGRRPWRIFSQNSILWEGQSLNQK